MHILYSYKTISKIVPILLGIFASLIYAININGEFVFDDFTYFIQNNVLTNSSPFDFYTLFNTVTNLWGEVYPFRDFLYILQYKAFGEWTTGYHIVSIILMLCTYFVLFKFISQLIKGHLKYKNSDLNKDYSTWLITVLITSFFLFHPIYVESFSYISGQKDALSLLFILTTMHFIHKAGTFKSNIILYFILGIFFHYIAVLSKFSALLSIVFIPILLIITSMHSRKITTMFIVAWLFANIPVVLWFFHTMQIATDINTMPETIPILERFPRAINYIGSHISHILKPWPLNLGYPSTNYWIFNFHFLLGSLFLVLFLLLSIIKRNKFVILGLCIFVLYISTVIHIYPDIPNDKVYDRYLAVPFIGIIIALIPAIHHLLSKNNVWKKTTIIILSLIITILGILTTQYLPVYKNHLIALEHNYKYFPEKKDALFNYANELINKMELNTAEEVINSSVEFNPENGEKKYMLGRIALERKNYYRAITLLSKSSEESSLNGRPNYADTPLAEAYIAVVDYEKAHHVLTKIIINNQHPVAIYKAKIRLEELKQLKLQQEKLIDKP